MILSSEIILNGEEISWTVFRGKGAEEKCRNRNVMPFHPSIGTYKNELLAVAPCARSSITRLSWKMTSFHANCQRRNPEIGWITLWNDKTVENEILGENKLEEAKRYTYLIAKNINSYKFLRAIRTYVQVRTHPHNTHSTISSYLVGRVILFPSFFFRHCRNYDWQKVALIISLDFLLPFSSILRHTNAKYTTYLV